jgi:hypothetical protein
MYLEVKQDSYLAEDFLKAYEFDFKIVQIHPKFYQGLDPIHPQVHCIFQDRI